MRLALESLEEEAQAALADVNDLGSLEAWRIAYLGSKGRLTGLMGRIGQLPPDERPESGRLGNRVKQALETAYEAEASRLQRRDVEWALEAGRVDVTLPGRSLKLGRAHPITQILREMRAALGSLGFHVVEGREVESDEFCFELLNMPPDHPARDMQDTFYVDGARVLRTHTSAAQVRYMRRFGAPLRVAVPGKCFRVDKPDPSHNWMFHQMEGFVIGEHITLADLKGTVAALVGRIFGPGSRLRFRGSYFPYTEPSVEADLACTVCGGTGCRLCSETGWLEIIPGGMIHPVVLRNGGLDPGRYTGFAFGAGPDRIAALKYRLDDIRYLYENDLRFVEQF